MEEIKNIEKMKNKCYRIVSDRHSGHEVQVKKRFLFWTHWEQVPHYYGINTWQTLEEAKDWINQGCPKHPKFQVRTLWISECCKNSEIEKIK
jgi:hypothetical protein